MKKLYLIFFLILTLGYSFSQTTLVAELAGNPIDTSGWEIVSGDTGGGYVDGNEFVFTDDATGQKGAIFFDQEFNLNQCKSWRIEYEARIWGTGTPSYGNGDGIAFWYLDNPPQNFADGGGIGIPLGARGIMVIMDTFENSTEAQQSELQVYYGQISNNPYENNTTGMSYFNTIPLGVNVRSSNYQQVIIEWNDGLITVSIAGTEICSFTPPPQNGAENLTAGYFGFSGTTGAASDKHSIKNVRVFMDVVQLNVNESIPMEQCDADGDGFADAGFNLTSQEAVLIDNPENYTIQYYEDQNDLSTEITDPSDFVNTTPNNQTIYVRVLNTEDCFEWGEIDLIIHSMPEQNDITIQDAFCAEGGELIIDLTSYQTTYINGSTVGLTFSYFEDYGLTIPIPQSDWTDYAIDTFPHSVWIKAEKDFGTQICSTIEDR